MINAFETSWGMFIAFIDLIRCNTQRGFLFKLRVTAECAALLAEGNF